MSRNRSPFLLLLCALGSGCIGSARAENSDCIPQNLPDASLLAQCNNDVDDDGDGLIDSNDDGCFEYRCGSRWRFADDDDNEADQDPPHWEFACCNGVDDDADSQIDYASDPGCDCPADTDELNFDLYCPQYYPIVIDVSPIGWVYDGWSEPPMDGEHESPVCGGLGAEKLFAFDMPTYGSVIVSTDYPETTVDTIVYLGTCYGDRSEWVELSCNDNGGWGFGSSLAAWDLEPGTYYIFVDTAGPGMVGDFLLTVTAD